MFARIERWTSITDSRDNFWQSISKDNITTCYGKTENSRITNPTNPAQIFSWLICESYDDKGNVISYEYKAEDSDNINLFQVNERNRNSTSRAAQRYLKRIKYGNIKPYFPKINRALPSGWMYEAVFDYGEHNDQTPYRAGFEVRTYRLCQRVLMFHHFPDIEEGYDGLVRSTDFNYRHQQSPDDQRDPIHSVIDSVTQCSYQKNTDDNSYVKKILPPVEFGYSLVVWGDEIEKVALDSTKTYQQE